MILYRYEDHVYSTFSINPGGTESYGMTEVRVELYEYEVVKETSCGYWIIDKWISKTWKKRFAYPSKLQALESFKIRKKRQIFILQHQLNRAQEALLKANQL